ncbi:MAG: DUF3805 domain-containing protein [Leptospiraceae bacterium]|nr:DUF3805 domain-containing protein [Leptospiraceae bacterium]MCP5510631.1 DUF3805 domain-containing protein [Leptospiraceae bacterium]
MAMRLEYQPYRSPQGWYNLIYPEYWTHEVIEGVPVFYDPEGSGAVVVTALMHSSGEYDIDLELKNYLIQHEIEYDPEKVANFRNSEGSEIRACEFISKERFWLVYMVSNGKQLIVCSYNSDESPDSDLSGILTTIISSIRFLNTEE